MLKKLPSLLLVSLLFLSLSAFDALPAGQPQSGNCTAAQAEAGECKIDLDEDDDEEDENDGWWNSLQDFNSPSHTLGLIFLQPYEVSLIDERLTQTGDGIFETWERQQNGQFSSFGEALGIARTKGNSLLDQWIAERGEPGQGGQTLGGGPTPPSQNDGSSEAAAAQGSFEGDRTGAGISVSDSSWWQIGLNWLVDQAVGAVTGWLPGDSGARLFNDEGEWDPQITVAGFCIWGCDVDDEEPEEDEEPVEDSEEPEEDGEDDQTDLELCESGDEAACARVNQEDASNCPPELAGCNDGEEIEIPAEIAAELGADPCIDPGAAPGVNPCLVNPGEEGGNEPANPDEVAELVPESPCGPPDAGIAAPIDPNPEGVPIDCDEPLPENFNDPNQGAVDPKEPDDDNPFTPVSGGTTPGETGGGDPIPVTDSDDKGAAGNADEASEQGSDESESAPASDASEPASGSDGQGESTVSQTTTTEAGAYCIM